MILPVSSFSDLADSAAAGTALSIDIARKLSGQKPGVLIVFASPQHDHKALLTALASAFPTTKLVGCSSAGEFTAQTSGTGSVSIFAIASDEMQFRVGLGCGVRENVDGVVTQIASALSAPDDFRYSYRTALVLADALAGHTDELIEKLTIATGGLYQFVGGGAGDDANFKSTHVFSGTEAYTDAVVTLEILSDKPVGVGARHGWEPASPGMRVTESDGASLISLNGFPAAQVYQDYIEESGAHFDASNPLPHFLHNIVGIDTGSGFKLRVPVAIQSNGALQCAADIPEGAIVSFMRIEAASAADAAAKAAAEAIGQLGEHPVGAALFFDCVATRLRMGESFAGELDAVGRSLGTTVLGGCNTNGQIVRRDGQFNGFHNCTAVVCAFPR